MQGESVATRVVSARAHGDDRVVVLELGIGRVLIVADGAGGMAHGSAAAESAIELIGREIRDAAEHNLTAPLLCDLLQRADDALAATPACGETTLVIAALVDGRVVGASCGDSGALLMRAEGSVIDLTQYQNRKRLGSGRAAPVPFTSSWEHGDTLLLATDGLLKYADSTRIEKGLRTADLEQCADQLVGLARLPHGGLIDDVGLALARLRA